MKRGEVWTVAGGQDYAGKPRPALIVQDELFEDTASVTICGFTTQAREAALFRVPISPGDDKGLRRPCQLMIDKITTVPKAKLGQPLGRLGADDMTRVNKALILFLGLATSV